MAINTGVVAFAGTTIFFRSMRWFIRVGLALFVLIVSVVGLWRGLPMIVRLDSAQTFRVFLVFQLVALCAIIWTIVWLFRRKPIRYGSVLKWIAISCAIVGACITCVTIVFMLAV
jgi:hypothetical protein